MASKGRAEEQALRSMSHEREIRLTPRVKRLLTALEQSGLLCCLLRPQPMLAQAAGEAGKTTLANGLQASLPFPARVVYMGLTGVRAPGVVLAVRLILLWCRYAFGVCHRARVRLALWDPTR